LFYFIKIPVWIKWLYKSCVWNLNPKENNLYITFDDGPHPTITPLVLDELKKYNAKATFFCIGKNVDSYHDVYQRIIDEGHAVGNHTHNHLNGWRSDDEVYLNDIWEAKKHIDSSLFRPPYGRISSFQIKQLAKERFKLKVVMWSVLSGDFDKRISNEDCSNNVLLNAKSGSIVVFHDSEKAQEKMLYALPKVLSYFSERGFSFKKIENFS
jgi:peptidoglycan/xylan/chitin deacetylase (PgdA/CDA1 family)